MALSLPESATHISNPHNLDDSVEEVFSLVLGCTCSRVTQAGLDDENSLMAVVGFGGILSGACVLRCGARTAMAIAGRMLGSEFTEMDATVQDAMGEICNMLAGGWKGRIPELSSDCGLSVPAVITGRDYRMHVHPPKFQLRHCYRFEDLQFEVMIVCEGLGQMRSE